VSSVKNSINVVRKDIIGVMKISAGTDTDAIMASDKQETLFGMCEKWDGTSQEAQISQIIVGGKKQQGTRIKLRMARILKKLKMDDQVLWGWGQFLDLQVNLHGNFIARRVKAK